MIDLTLALYEHRLGNSEALALPPGNRVLYVVDGAAKLASADAAVGLAANSAWCGAGALAIDSGAGATVLRFELARGDAVRAGRLVLAAPLTLDPGQKYLM